MALSSVVLPSVLAAEGPFADQPLSDPQLTLTRAALAGLVADLKGRITEAGLANRRICVPLDASLGSMAALIAVIESGSSAALIPRPAAETLSGTPADAAHPEWPAFCDAVLLPPDAALGAGSAQLLPLAGAGAGDGGGRVYLRTSGTTGAPKWAVHDKARLLQNARACITRLGLSPADRVLIPVPMHHMYGLGAGLLPSLLAGAAIHLVPRGNPLEVFRAQRAFLPNVMFLVPSQCRSIMALNRGGDTPARLVVVAGDKLAPDEAAAFEAKHGLLVCLYGSTELGAITAGRPEDPAALRHLTAGPPMEGMTLALEPAVPDAAADGAVPMRVRSLTGLLGYADATGTLVSQAPEVWETGDLVRLHPGDRIEVLGRADHAVNRDGLLVHMGAIEASLGRAAGVTQATVVAVGRTRRGIGLAAFCTLARGAVSTEEDILRHCRADLPPRAVPDWLFLRDALPMLASGKVDRRALTAEAELHLES